MLSIAEYFLDSWRALGLKCLMARPSRSLLGAVSSIFYTVQHRLAVGAHVLSAAANGKFRAETAGVIIVGNYSLTMFAAYFCGTACQL